jgi:hypothetical protein
MLTTLLFIAIIINSISFTKGFTKLNPRLIPFSKTKLHVRLTSTTFYDDKDENDKRNKYDFNYDCNYDYYSNPNRVSDSDSDFNFNNHIRDELPIIPNDEKVDDYETLYTLIWFDCEDCINLLRYLKNDNKKILYVNGTHYFFDENDETNRPLFYKNDQLIATDVFSIYEELYYNKIIEE